MCISIHINQNALAITLTSKILLLGFLVSLIKIELKEFVMVIEFELCLNLTIEATIITIMDWK